MPTIPFTISDEHGHVISGLLFLEEQFVVFDLEVKKWGLFQETPEKVKAEFGLIESIRLDRGFFKDHVYLVPKRSDLLKAVPGSHKGEIKLNIAKRYREQAQELVQEVRSRQRNRAGK
ncbi:MAG TPA: hypothetical protein VFG50_03305 [Rhodothermales bacterium]|nr:hypothetical protein [Rhodothermales bacterium]